MTLGRDLEALLFLAPEPVPVAELADALRVEEDEVRGRPGGAAARP